MNYIQFGKGCRTMVILPGLSLKPVCPLADSIAAAYEIFQKDFTVYLFDRREDIPEHYSLEQMADDTAERIKEIGLKDICLYGVSQGGMIAQILTLKYPELVKKLALASTCSCVEEEAGNGWIEAARNHDLDGLLKEFASDVYGREYYEQYKDMIHGAYGDLSEKEMDRFAVMASAVQGFDIRKEAGNINIPVYVTGSRDDRVIPIARMEESARLLKAESCFYEGYSHAVYDESADLKEKVYVFFMKEEQIRIPEIGRLEDDIWPKQGYDHIRYTARALVENQDGKLGFLHIVGEDFFGMRDHLETCGGGIEEGEYADQTLQREVLEELGYRVQSYELLGALFDTYNALKRITCSIFFHCRVDTSIQEATNRTEEEKLLFKEVLWLDPEEALDRLENDVRCDIGRLVQQRDALALRYYLEHKRRKQ